MPLARVKVEENSCSERIEWGTVRETSQQTLLRHIAIACWKHSALSFAGQSRAEPLPTHRGAEQGDVDGPSECSIALEQVASETRTKVASLQRQGALPWIPGDRDGAGEDCGRRSVRVHSFLKHPEVITSARAPGGGRYGRFLVPSRRRHIAPSHFGRV